MLDASPIRGANFHSLSREPSRSSGSPEMLGKSGLGPGVKHGTRNLLLM